MEEKKKTKNSKNEKTCEQNCKEEKARIKNLNNFSPTGDTGFETGLRNAGIIW